MLAINEVVDHAAPGWGRGDRGIQGGEVFNRIWFIAPQDIAHAV
jgi:hypothetical protein